VSYEAGGRRGASRVDVLVLLAALSVIGALAYPRWAARAFQERVVEVIADVDAVTARARSTLEVLGRLPAPGLPGESPPELTGLEFSRPTYTLQWTTWEVVDSVPGQPEDPAPLVPGTLPAAPVVTTLQPVVRMVGAVAVHSRESALLAELLRHYGPTASFVLDTTWIGLLADRPSTAIAR
jgi:hypothetical protein